MIVREAAAKLGVSEGTVRQQIAAGSLRAEKHGRDWWIEAEEVERYQREHRGRPGRRKS